MFPHECSSKGFEIYFDRPVSEQVAARASYTCAVADEVETTMVTVNSSDLLTYDDTTRIRRTRRTCSMPTSPGA